MRFPTVNRYSDKYVSISKFHIYTLPRSAQNQHLELEWSIYAAHEIHNIKIYWIVGRLPSPLTLIKDKKERINSHHAGKPYGGEIYLLGSSSICITTWFV
jgi:hypothetical protein